ncbi:hypothetical protein B0H67DRAFT_41436 [Lasiosphaeris hirsuta]|uniref:Zinc finger PHD-type domain-containing protein n=1 Tax=Lasiosphaeris hirsuta TaxID=260670 RepID=A0AA40EA09_9PEZI|nr:hypothetical protein B0H67DRAFT_41436 [Lasiosphaeris hirsuta]
MPTPRTRKRTLSEVELGNTQLTQPPQSPKPPSTLHRIRNMWQFANLFQFVLLFGKALKLDDNLDIEDLEAECLKPGSTTLQDIGLGFLKFLSSHRGLTLELFDEYTRRQYLSKAPEKNPFGTEEAPARFADFDVFTKIRVLHQMTQFILMAPEKLRERTEEQKDSEQSSWRIEPYGWDHEDRTYFVLDDNRIYRLTEAPPPPPPKPKKNSKKARAAHRSSKRRRISTGVASDAEDTGDAGDAGDEASESGAPAQPEDDGLGGMKWECIAVTLDEVREFLSGIHKTKDSNEKVLRDQILDHLVPILEKQEESMKRKQLQREKELLNLEKLAHAKRSSRIATKVEQQKVQELTREEAARRKEEEAARRKEEAQRLKMERERDKRLMARERRLREREIRRLQHEEELAQLSEDSKSTGTGPGRMSERRRLAEIEKNKQALKEIEEEEDDWIFDCTCGVYGQIDDGSHSVACERCNIWQHSQCLGINEEEAEQEDFHFVCEPCRKREQEVKEQRPRIIKIKVIGNRAGSLSSSPPQKVAQLVREPSAKPAPNSQQANGFDKYEPDNPPNESSDENSSHVGQFEKTDKVDANSRGLSAARLPRGPDNNPFSSLHPNLSPPGQRLGQSRAYDSIFHRSDPTPASGDVEVPPSNGTFAIVAGNRSGLSPSKLPQRPISPSPTKTSPTATTESRELGSAIPAVLPHFTPVPSRTQPGARHNGTPLPPSYGGLSPTKQSPAVPHHQTNGIVDSISTPLVGANHSATVFPPATALSPSPHQQILTPPVKPTEPRALSQEKA